MYRVKITKFLLCDPFVPWMEHFITSILYTYKRLNEFGLKDVNGEIELKD